MYTRLGGCSAVADRSRHAAGADDVLIGILDGLCDHIGRKTSCRQLPRRDTSSPRPPVVPRTSNAAPPTRRSAPKRSNYARSCTDLVEKVHGVLGPGALA
jgi:hypothetical protein